ncbi:uncharacterized protein BO80DRAFT_28421 [Aspergillus ibericus CBS 121593]|uniref:RING-type domain-containing protein n=1 Tax=Aspergillus ibericus CBS 121593 TaxID=1448316 RepID=A0A395H4S1_9EURO|nr:hypothetical protein BO80DRAFT_28421 [Aspergillus ibericus CBS 121593]RAL02660.1 hypothetical protein BO80DRAFT_28421 [Aspergillus ibericus CBS 121593]
MSSSPLAQLTDILKIYPAEDHHCFGTSNYYNRRCNNLTNHHNRQVALVLLDRGTRQLAATPFLASFDNLLDQLAPLLLCPHLHRSQAPRLVAQWKEKLQRHLDEHLPAAPATMNNRILPNPGNNVLSTGGVLTISNLANHVSASPSIIAYQHGRVSMGASHSRVEIGHPGVHPSSSSMTTAMSAAASHAHPHTSALHPATPPFLRPSDVHPHQHDHDHESDSDSSSIGNFPVTKASEKRRVKPRPVDGDCGICLLPYLDERMRYEMSEDEEMEDVDDADDEEGAWEEMEDDDLAGPDYDHDLLVWCRAFCGTNYHRACMEQWIDTFDVHEPTCPTCRNYWIY